MVKKNKGLILLLILLFIPLAEMLNSQTGPVNSREKRLALVIGNGAYRIKPLKNPVHDANDMAAALTKRGFDVILKTNADYKTMWYAIREFGRKLQNSDVGLFYYSGHGVQVKGINYLLPTDMGKIPEDEIQFKAINAGLVLGKMEKANNSMNIVILDACRSNPYKKSYRGREGDGLARMDAPTGSLIVYSTSPGKTASDGRGRNGAFTKHLLNGILYSKLEIGYMLREVRKKVLLETGRKQTPWESSSLIGEFYFFHKKGTGKITTLPTGNLNSKSVEFHKLSFFESGKTLLSKKQRKYTYSFKKDTTRYINSKLIFKNNLYQKNDSTIHVVLKFYKPGGSYWNSIKRSIKVGKNLAYGSYERLGWGWEKSGNWQVGKYTVKVYIDNDYSGESYFNIMGKGQKITTNYQFNGMRFFESGSSLPKTKIDYSNRFLKKNTRYVYLDIWFKNTLYQIRDQTIKVTVKYLKPDGSLFGKSERKVKIPKNLKNATYNKIGWGWKTSNKWTPGRYKVKVYFNDRFVGESSFSITSQSRISGDTYTFDSIRFYESGSIPDKDTKQKYSARFSKLTTRYVFTDIYFYNKLYLKRDQIVSVRAKYYKPDNSLWGNIESKVLVGKKFNKASYYKLGWGWKKAGYWQKGIYRVKIYFNEKFIGESFFQVY